MIRPSIGETSLLVYRECLCGEWCATGEGACAPICSACGRRMVPVSPGDEGHEARRTRGLGFVAFLTNEMAAADLVGKGRKFLGLAAAGQCRTAATERLYWESDVQATLERMGMPTDPQWDAPDLEGGGGPPWEKTDAEHHPSGVG